MPLGQVVSAGFHKFVVAQGETWRVILTVSDTGGTLNLTGYTARMQLRESVDSPLPLVSLSTDPGGGMTVDGPAGQISWVVADEVTATWTWRHAVFDLFWESPGGEERRPLRGEVVVDPVVTR